MNVAAVLILQDNIIYAAIILITLAILIVLSEVCFDRNYDEISATVISHVSIAKIGKIHEFK